MIYIYIKIYVCKLFLELAINRAWGEQSDKKRREALHGVLRVLFDSQG